MMNPYLAGAYIIGAVSGEEDLDTRIVELAVERPMSAACARELVSLCLTALRRGGGAGWRDDIARQLANIDASIQSCEVDPLPDKAADILSGVAALLVDGSAVVGARTKQTALVGTRTAIGPRGVVGYTYDPSKSGIENMFAWADSATVVGMYDIASAEKQMTALKQVTVRAGQALLKGGQTAINRAIEIADEQNLPGPTERNNVRAHLQWHANELAKMSSTPNAMYAPGEDLKKYVMMAFVDANAVEEGAAYLQAAWDLMWQEIAAAIAALPAEVRKVVVDTTNAVVQSVTGLPLWAWGLIAVGAVGLVGYVGYKVATGPVGGAVAKHYLGR